MEPLKDSSQNMSSTLSGFDKHQVAKSFSESIETVEKHAGEFDRLQGRYALTKLDGREGHLLDAFWHLVVLDQHIAKAVLTVGNDTEDLGIAISVIRSWLISRVNTMPRIGVLISQAMENQRNLDAVNDEDDEYHVGGKEKRPPPLKMKDVDSCLDNT